MERVITLDGEKISVDEHCADLVSFFNNIGLKTAMCCQGHRKPIYRIWFDVDDELMENFIKKVWTEWTNTGWNFTNEDNTEYELTEYPRGINGWIYKRLRFPHGKLIEDWVYQTEGENNEEAINNAYEDLEILRAIYYGENYDKLKKKEREEKLAVLERCVSRNENIARAER